MINPRKKQKLAIVEDDVNRYGVMIVHFEEELIPSYASIYPKKKEEPFHPASVEIFEESLFDSQNMATIRQSIGPRGILSLILRKGYYLGGLFCSPSDVSIDLTINSQERLVYQFFNHVNCEEIEVNAILKEDDSGVASDVKLYEDDLGLRQFYVIKAKENFEKFNQSTKSAPWEMEIKEAAKYLNLSVKTLYNYNAMKIIPCTSKAGRIKYLKDDLDAFLTSKRGKK